ncbi:hypothetical protein IAT40_004372 [Kwoniella sp. CBS 6097]
MVRTAREPNPPTPHILRVSTSSATSSRRSSAGGGSPSQAQPMFVKTASTTKSPFSSSRNTGGTDIGSTRKRAVLGERAENILSPQHPSTVKANKLKSKPKPSLTPKAKQPPLLASPARDLSGLSRFIAKSPQMPLAHTSRFDIPSSSSPLGHSDNFLHARPGSTPYAPRPSMPMRLNEDDTLLLNMAPPEIGFSSPRYDVTDDSDMEAETSRSGARKSGGLMTPANSQEVSLGSPSRAQTIRKHVQTASIMRNPISRLPTPPSSQAEDLAVPLPPTPQVSSSSRSSRIRARPSPTPPRRRSKEPPAELNFGDITAEWDTPLKMGEDISPNPRKKKSPRLSQPGGTPTRIRSPPSQRDRVEIVLPSRRSTNPLAAEAQTPATVKPKGKGKGRASRTPSVGLSQATNNSRRSSGGNRRNSGGSTGSLEANSTPGPSQPRTAPATAPMGREKSVAAKGLWKRSRTTTPSDSATLQAKSRRQTLSSVATLKTPAPRKGTRKSVGMTPKDRALSGRKLGMLSKPIHGSPGDDPLLLKPYYEPSRQGAEIRDGAGLGLSGAGEGVGVGVSPPGPSTYQPKSTTEPSPTADDPVVEIPVSSPFRFPGADDMTLLPMGSPSGRMEYFDPGPAWSDDGSDAEGGAGDDTFIHVKQRQQDRSDQLLGASISQQTVVEEDDEEEQMEESDVGVVVESRREESPFAPPREIMRAPSQTPERALGSGTDIAAEFEDPEPSTAANPDIAIVDPAIEHEQEHEQHSISAFDALQYRSASPLHHAGDDNSTDLPEQVVEEDFNGADVTVEMEGGEWDTSEPEIAQIQADSKDVMEEAESLIQDSPAHTHEVVVKQPSTELPMAKDLVDSAQDQDGPESPLSDSAISLSDQEEGEDDHEDEAVAGDVTQDAEGEDWDVSDDTLEVHVPVRAGIALLRESSPVPAIQQEVAVGGEVQDDDIRRDLGVQDEEEAEDVVVDLDLSDDSSEEEADPETGDVTVEVQDGAWDVSADVEHLEEEVEEGMQKDGQFETEEDVQLDQRAATISEVFQDPPARDLGEENLDEAEVHSDATATNDGSTLVRPQFVYQVQEYTSGIPEVQPEEELPMIEVDESVSIVAEEVTDQPAEIEGKTPAELEQILENVADSGVALVSEQSVQAEIDAKDDTEIEHSRANSPFEAVKVSVTAERSQSPQNPSTASPILTGHSPVPVRSRFTPSLSPMPMPIPMPSTHAYRSTTPAFSPPPAPASGLHFYDRFSPAPAPASRPPFVLIKHRGDLTLAPTPRISLLDRSSKSPAPPDSALARHALTPSNGLSLSFGHSGYEPENGGQESEREQEQERDAFLEEADKTLQRLSALRSLSPPTLPVSLSPFGSEADLAQINASEQEPVDQQESPILSRDEFDAQDNQEGKEADSNIANESESSHTHVDTRVDVSDAKDEIPDQILPPGSVGLHVAEDKLAISEDIVENGSASGNESVAGDLTIEAETSAWDMSTEDIAGPVLYDQSEFSDGSEPDQDQDQTHDAISEAVEENDQTGLSKHEHDEATAEQVEQEEQSDEEEAEAESAGEEAEDQEEDQGDSPPPAEVPEKIILRLVESGIIKLEPASDDEEQEDDVHTLQRSTTPSQSPVPALAQTQVERGLSNSNRQLTPRTPERTQTRAHLEAYRRILSASPGPGENEAPATTTTATITPKSPVRSSSNRGEKAAFSKSSVQIQTQSTTPKFAPPSTPLSRPIVISTTPTYSPPSRATQQPARQTENVDQSAEKRMLSQRVRGKASRLSQAFIPSSEPSSPVPLVSEQPEQETQHDGQQQVDIGTEAELEIDEKNGREQGEENTEAGDRSVVVRKPRRSLQDELFAAAAAENSSDVAGDDGAEEAGVGNDSFRSVVEVSSLDPKAAARAAAILKLNHAYIEHGVLSRSEKGTESTLASVRKSTSTSHSEAEKRELLHEAELEIVDSYRRSQTRSPSRGPGPREMSVPRSGLRGRGRDRSMSVMSFMTEDYPIPGGYIKTPTGKLPAQSQSRAILSSRKRQRPPSDKDTEIQSEEHDQIDLTLTKNRNMDKSIASRDKKRWGVPEWKKLEKVYRKEKEDWIKEREVKGLPGGGGLVAWARRSTFGLSMSSTTKVKEWDSERVVEKFLVDNKGWDREMLALRVQAIERRVNQVQEKKKNDSNLDAQELATPAAKKLRSHSASTKAIDASTSSQIPSTPFAQASSNTNTDASRMVPPSTIRRMLGFVWGAGKNSTSQAPAASASGSPGLLERLEEARDAKGQGKGKGKEQEPILPLAMSMAMSKTTTTTATATAHGQPPMKQVGPGLRKASSSHEKSIVSAAESASASASAPASAPAPPKASSRTKTIGQSTMPLPSSDSASITASTTITTATDAATQSQAQAQPYKRLYPSLDPPMTQRSSAIAKLFPDSASNASLFSSASSTSSSRSISRRSLELSNMSSRSLGSYSDTTGLGGSGSGKAQVVRKSGSVKDLVKDWEGKKMIFSSSSGGKSVSGR